MFYFIYNKDNLRILTLSLDSNLYSSVLGLNSLKGIKETLKKQLWKFEAT